MKRIYQCNEGPFEIYYLKMIEQEALFIFFNAFIYSGEYTYRSRICPTLKQTRNFSCKSHPHIHTRKQTNTRQMQMQIMATRQKKRRSKKNLAGSSVQNLLYKHAYLLVQEISKSLNPLQCSRLLPTQPQQYKYLTEFETMSSKNSVLLD